jgi:hypothetical protein
MLNIKTDANAQAPRDDVNRRPSPETVKARHAEIARRYAWNGKNRRSRKPGHGMANFRVRELERLYADRHGLALPNTVSGRDALFIALHHIVIIAEFPDIAMRRWAAIWAPWIDEDELQEIIEKVFAKPLRWGAETLGKRLNLSQAERQHLDIRTFRKDKAARAAQAKINRKDREAKRRRAKGAVPRDEYLAKSLPRTRPWDADDICERTWRRRQKREQEKNHKGVRGACPIDRDTMQGMDFGHVDDAARVPAFASALAALRPPRPSMVDERRASIASA